MNINYFEKYLKYKNKYLNIKNKYYLYGGSINLNLEDLLESHKENDSIGFENDFDVPNVPPVSSEVLNSSNHFDSVNQDNNKHYSFIFPAEQFSLNPLGSLKLHEENEENIENIFKNFDIPENYPQQVSSKDLINKSLAQYKEKDNSDLDFDIP
jgi:hypothetical protein